MHFPNRTILQRFLRQSREKMFSAGSYEFGTITILAVVVGLISGYAAIGFYLGIAEVLKLGFGVDEASLASGVSALPAWIIIGVPVTGGLIVGQLLRLIPDGQTRGVANVIESAALNNGHLNAKEGLISAVTTVISLGSGASMGREGPVVHLGATMASVITRALHLNPTVGRTLLGCGVAAAVAASFNAPIAGVFFALEVVIGHYALHAFAPIVISAIAGTLASRAHLGDFPAFQITDHAITSFWEFPAFFLLGIASALVSVVFMAGMTWADRQPAKIKRIPHWLLPGFAGLCMGLIALVYPEVLSVGYEATTSALNGSYGLSMLLALLVAKIIASMICFGGRFGGGFFSPTLFIGAMAGGAYGIIAGSIFPELASSPGLYAVVGMGAVASAVLGAPISTMLIVFEITGDYNLTIAVMIASAVSSNVTSQFYRRSLFLMQLAGRGIRLEGGKATYLLKSAKVIDHMSRDFFTVNEAEPLIKARELLVAQGGGLLIVTDNAGCMVGTLGFGQLRPDVFEDARAADKLLVGSFVRESSHTVKSNDALQIAMTRMDTSGEDILPVLSPTQKGVVVGLISNRHVMKEYNRALLETQGQDQGFKGRN
jgi:chloride channel protein, CIC family